MEYEVEHITEFLQKSNYFKFFIIVRIYILQHKNIKYVKHSELLIGGIRATNNFQLLTVVCEKD